MHDHDAAHFVVPVEHDGYHLQRLPQRGHMLHHHLATRPTDSLFRVCSISLLPRQPKSKSKEDRPQWVRRLIEYSWDYDRICLRVERLFPPPASTALERRNHREWIARLVVRYWHGELVTLELLQKPLWLLARGGGESLLRVYLNCRDLLNRVSLPCTIKY